MQPIRFAVAIVNFSQPIRQAIKTAVSMHAQGIQLALDQDLKLSDLSESACRQFLHQLTDFDLKIASCHFPTRRGLTDATDVDERLSNIRQAMNTARRLGCGHLTMRIGRVPSETESKEYVLVKEILSDLAQYGNHVGTVPCITPTNDTVASLGDMIRSIPTGFLAVDFDPAGFVLCGQDPVQALQSLHDRILHVQARDAIRDIDGTGQEMAVGKGVIKWDEVLALLAEIPYQGWITVNRSRGDHKIIESADAIQYLTSIGFR